MMSQCPENANAPVEGRASGETKNPKKYQRILQILYDGAVLDFQSARSHGDSCLHTTVSTLQNKFGIVINALPHLVNGWDGRSTHCKKYSLNREGENIKRARAVLDIDDGGE